VIFYLLVAGEHSRWHAVASDEQWTFLEGDPIDLFTVSPEGRTLNTARLGPIARGHDPVAIVPASYWQAARPAGAFALVSCSVAPGFAFEDFRFLADTPAAETVVTPVLGELKALL
jgi:predicted cupin superfamily sugar epimerase